MMAIRSRYPLCNLCFISALFAVMLFMNVNNRTGVPIRIEDGYAPPDGPITFTIEDRMKRFVKCHKKSEGGFTLIEMLISLIILTFGLLAAGQLMAIAMGSASLARSKGNAAVVARDRLEALADLYRQNASAAELSLGNHGPVQVQVMNTVDNNVMNRYNVAWNVAVVPDARGKVLDARLVRVTVTPINAAGGANSRTSMNKIVNMSAIFSPRVN